MRSLSLLLVLLSNVGLPFAASAEEVTIGVRNDTPPFVSTHDDSSAYVGFFYSICTEAVTRAGYQFIEVSVDATQRNEFLTNGIGDYDVLCDPTTITLSRMRNFAPVNEDKISVSVPPATHLDFSQIIFVANGGYVTEKTPKNTIDQEVLARVVENWRKDNIPEDHLMETLETSATGASFTPQCEALFEQVDDVKKQIEEESETEETADATPASDEAPEKEKKFIVFRYTKPKPEEPKEATRLLGYVVGSTIGEKVFEFRQANVEAVPCTFPSHVDAAKAFCEGKLHRYYGDIDIIRASIAKHKDQECETIEAAGDDLTYEPYALVISSKKFPDLRERFTCAIYSMFQDGTMDKKFKGYFGGKTPRLETLFWINGIPAGRSNSEDARQYVCGIPR